MFDFIAIDLYLVGLEGYFPGFVIVITTASFYELGNFPSSQT